MRGLASLVEPEARTVSDPWGPSWGLRPANTVEVDQWSAYQLSAVWACSTLIADAIATVPVDTFRKQGDLRTETTKPAFLVRPNSENGRIDYETQRMLSLLNWGNAYSVLVRKYGTHDPMDPVVERWLMNPAHVAARRVNPQYEESDLVYWVHGKPVPAENMQHIRGYVPPGGFLGMSVIQQAARALGITMLAENAGESFYAQGMMQSGVISVPQLPADISKDVTDRMRDAVIERHAGSGNAGKPMILTGGATWANTMISPQDAQFMETRKFQINEICRWYRVPGHKIQDIVAHASQGGGMGIEQQSGEFSQDTLLPWTCRLEEADSELIPRGQVVKYNLDAYVRTDLAAQTAYFTAARLGGWLNADEVRAKKDMQPLPDGKGQVYLQPANYIEAGTTLPGIPEPGVPTPPAQGATPNA